MKHIAIIFCLFIGIQLGFSQAEFPELDIQQSEIEGHLRFLASDAMMGRRTGEAGNNIAANYIVQYLKTYGVQMVDGADGYYQPVGFEALKPPNKGSLTLGKTTYTQGENLLILTGKPLNIKKAQAVYAGFGWVDEETGHDDYKDLDVAGKVVFVIPGTPAGDDPLTIFQSMAKKRKFAAEKGAVALFELYRLSSFPWEFFKNYFGKETLTLKQNDQEERPSITYGWIKEKTSAEIEQLASGKKLKTKLVNSGYKLKEVMSQNVIGVIPGSDDQLKDEYVLLSAHYDHVGTGKNGGGAFTPADSIFNGARDNAMGTVALLSAAKALAQNPPKRPVVILAVTGEEIGLLGSSYYSNNPIIDLKKTIFNLNTDGAGYNDTKYISILGMGRTGTDEQITKGVEALGLEVFADPAPEQGLFDRSDNVSFAKKGVPALTFSPGFTGFTGDIMTYYHQVVDEADAIDFAYMLKYCQSFAHTARLIANMDGKPTWKEGDKYEEAGKELYGN